MTGCSIEFSSAAVREVPEEISGQEPRIETPRRQVTSGLGYSSLDPRSAPLLSPFSIQPLAFSLSPIQPDRAARRNTTRLDLRPINISARRNGRNHSNRDRDTDRNRTGHRTGRRFRHAVSILPCIEHRPNSPFPISVIREIRG